MSLARGRRPARLYLAFLRLPGCYLTSTTQKHLQTNRRHYILFRHILYLCVNYTLLDLRFSLSISVSTRSSFVVYTLWAKGLGRSRHGIVRRLDPWI